MDDAPARRYARYRAALARRDLPAALIDLDALEANTDALVARARAGGKRVRIATKSLRCLELARRVAARAGGAVCGAMAYAAREAALLAQDGGFADVLLAYPVARPGDARVVAEANARGGAQVSAVVDAEEHLTLLDDAARAAGAAVPVVIDVDVSYRPLGARVHLGVRRSPLREPREAVALAESARARAGLRVAGVMAYDAQIAGVGDANPFAPWLDAPKRAIKLLSRPDVARRRAAVVAALRARGFAVDLVNGGGTGSIGWSADEAVLTEVAVGSGFVGSHLFDYYRDVRVAPAAFFALAVARRPAPGIVTCFGGGYVASGEPGPDRLPVPYLPRGLSYVAMEGAGEVQTPLVLPRGTDLAIGDPVIFRHAKGGELAERFDRYLLVRGDRIEGEAPTYRGMGHAFG